MSVLRQVSPAMPEPPAIAGTRPHSVWFDIHPALGISMMDHLFNRIDGAYPGRWRKDFPDAQAVENWRESWVEAFEDEGVTPAEVKVAIQAMRKRFSWPPSIAEFIALARPPVDPDAAYHEAVAGLQERLCGRMGEWSHRAVYWAADLLRHDLLKQGQEQVKARWKKVLAAQLERKGLPEIPAPALQLPAPGHSATERERAVAHMVQLQASNVFKRLGDPQDTSWARRILVRAQCNCPRLTRAVIAGAAQALGRTPNPQCDGPPTNAGYSVP